MVFFDLTLVPEARRGIIIWFVGLQSLRGQNLDRKRNRIDKIGVA